MHINIRRKPVLIVTCALWTFIGLACDSKTETKNEREGATLEKEVTSENFTPRDGAGCIQGAVVDGQTGQKLDLTERIEGLGIFVMIRGQRRLASVIDTDGRDALVGEYYICGVPLDEEYLIFADLDGYLPFQSTIRVDSTTRSAEGKDLSKADPLLLANIRLFPLETEVKDLKVNVVHEGLGVADALVRLDPTSENIFDRTGFLVPQSARLQSVSVYTDDEGIAEFNPDELVLGATYSYTVIPSGGDKKHNLLVADGTFTLGSGTASSNAYNGYEFTVSLSAQEEPLRIVSCLSERSDWNGDGSVHFVFNRPVRWVNRDDPVATLADVQARGGDGVTDSAVLGEDASDGDGKSEQVDVDVNGNSVALFPKFGDPKAPSASRDPGLYISYDPTSIYFMVEKGTYGETSGPISLARLLDDVAPIDPIEASDDGPAIEGRSGLRCRTSVYFFPFE